MTIGDSGRFHRDAALGLGIVMLLFLSSAVLRAHVPKAMQAQTRAPYANTADGLKQFLIDGVAAAKSGDKSKLDAFMKDTSILHAYDWFTATYGEKDSEARVDKYGSNVESNGEDVRDSLVRIARVGGKIGTRNVNDSPAPGSEIESDLLRGLKRPTRFYYAEWRKPEAAETEEGEFIGYFVFTAGKFRIATVGQSVIRLQGVRNPKTGAIEYTLPLPGRPSITGTKYKNPEGHFTLDLPVGWTINEKIAKAPMAIGALSDPDGGVNVVIQIMPAPESPSEFLQEFDAKGPTMFVDYKKIAEERMTVDGEDAASLTLTQTDREAGRIGIALPRTLEWFVVVVRVKGRDIFFNFTTTEAHFVTKEQTFREIINSFRLDTR